MGQVYHCDSLFSNGFLYLVVIVFSLFSIHCLFIVFHCFSLFLSCHYSMQTSDGVLVQFKLELACYASMGQVLVQFKLELFSLNRVIKLLCVAHLRLTGF
jgi:hypothetical protein